MSRTQFNQSARPSAGMNLIYRQLRWLPLALAFGLLTWLLPANQAFAQGCDCGEPVCSCPEPVCGCEPVCGLEPACGCEAGWIGDPGCGCDGPCSCEPACGCEPECDCEPQCGCESASLLERPICDLDASCGCEPACGCDLPRVSSRQCGCDGGLLGCNRPPKGPVYGLIDLVAGGIEQVVCRTKQCRARHFVRTCSCDQCDSGCATMEGEVWTQEQEHPILLDAPVQSVAPLRPPVPPPLHSAPAPRAVQPAPIPSVSPRVNSAPMAPKTTIQRSQPEPLPMAPVEAPDAKRPGALFDELQNPFEDDSVMKSARRPRPIRPATYTGRDAGSRSRIPQPVKLSPTTPTEQDDFSDYFRE